MVFLDPVALILVFICILIGVIASYTDVKKGKIPNYIVFPGILIAVIVNFFVIQFTSLLEFWTNLIFAMLFGFILYLANLWSAGDAKLYLAFASLIPVQFYSLSYFPYFPSFTLLVNTFAPIFIFTFFKLIKSTSFTDKIEALKESLEPKNIVNLSISLFAISWLIKILFNLTGLPLNLLAVALIIFIIFELVNKVLKIKEIKFTAGLSILIIIFDYPSLLHLEFWIFFIILLLTFVFLRFFILHLGFKGFGTKVQVEKLKPGMVPMDIVIKEGKYYSVRKGFYPSIFQVLDHSINKLVINTGTQGLSNEDISNLQKWKKEKTLSRDSLTIQGTMPFAPFIFLGVLITFILQGDFIYYLINLLL